MPQRIILNSSQSVWLAMEKISLLFYGGQARNLGMHEMGVQVVTSLSPCQGGTDTWEDVSRWERARSGGVRVQEACKLLCGCRK